MKQYRSTPLQQLQHITHLIVYMCEKFWREERKSQCAYVHILSSKFRRLSHTYITVVIVVIVVMGINTYLCPTSSKMVSIYLFIYKRSALQQSITQLQQIKKKIKKDGKYYHS